MALPYNALNRKLHRLFNYLIRRGISAGSVRDDVFTLLGAMLTELIIQPKHRLKKPTFDAG